MQVFARQELVAGRLDPLQPALLLEGSWPAADDVPNRWSLDDAINAHHTWIDTDATRLAGEMTTAPACELGAVPSIAYLNAVRLRYQWVKWLRLVAWFDMIHPLREGTHLRAVLQRDRDADYGQLLEWLAERKSLRVVVRWESPRGESRAESNAQLDADLWRRLASRVHRATDISTAVKRPEVRVLLCGNPRLLDPVCGELVQRRNKVWWLYERFAYKAWMRWRPSGVGQWVCDRTLDGLSSLPQGKIKSPLVARGYDFTELASEWLREQSAKLGVQQAEQVEQINQALDTIRPAMVVVDQDGTPFNRALIAGARARGLRTFVVQHGVPFVSFGFAPLEADYICAWGDTSRQQLTHWGVSPDRVLVTGSPAHDRQRLTTRIASRKPASSEGRPPHFVLLATVPPNDARPDLVAYHCTRASYERMLRTAFDVLSEYENATVLVKPHPRDTSQRLLHRLLGDYPALDALVVSRGSVEQCVRDADCVLSCASSSGVEATLAGVPVVQLMPEGSRDLIRAEDWGLVGTARRAEDLRKLIDRAIYDPSARRKGHNPSIIGNSTRTAAAQIVDYLLDRTLPRWNNTTVAAEERPVVSTLFHTASTSDNASVPAGS